MEFKAIWLGGTEEIKINLIYESQSPSQNLNLQQLKYKRVLNTLSQSLVTSQSQSHVTTDDQPVSMSWCQVHSGTRDQMLYSV
jgi:hypothetical protein